MLLPKPKKSSKSSSPSATVEVVDSSPERAERLLDFRSHMAPLLRQAYDLGYGSRTNVQMLREFMIQDPSHPHAPSIPSVYYNNFKPPEENPALKKVKQ